MWGLEISVSGQSSAQVHWLASGSVSVGRPAKAKGGESVDIVVQGDSAVSKVHALFLQQDHKLSIKDLGRYGTFVNNEKMQLDTVRELNEGDSVKMAAKVLIRIVRKPITICLSNGASLPTDLQEAACAIGAEVVHQWQDGVTHVLATDGQQACSVLARAMLTDTPVVTGDWLTKMTQQKVWIELPALEETCQPKTLSVPGLPGTSTAAGAQTVPFRACLRKDSNSTLLQGFIIFFVNSFQDDCLAYCLKALGTYMPETAPTASASHSTLCCSDAVQFVHCEDQAVLLPHMPAPELLACLLLGDISPIQQRLINADLLSRPAPCAHDDESAGGTQEPQEAAPQEDVVHLGEPGPSHEDLRPPPASVKSMQPAATPVKPPTKVTGEPSGTREAEFKKNRRPGGGAAAARKTGAGHAVAYLPLVTVQRGGAPAQGLSGSAGGGSNSSSVPNFKRFTKSRPTQGGDSQAQEAAVAAQVQHFPAMFVEPVPAVTATEPETRVDQSHGHKRNADSLFEEIQQNKGKKRKQ